MGWLAFNILRISNKTHLLQYLLVVVRALGRGLAQVVSSDDRLSAVIAEVLGGIEVITIIF
jgi:hypothetical protein